jgi:hypothetical protein
MALALAILLFGSMSTSAAAWLSHEWCEEDPILHFSDGGTAHITTAFPKANLTSDTVVTYNVVVSTGVHVTVTFPPKETIKAVVQVTTSSQQQEGKARITVSVSGGNFPIGVYVSTTSGDSQTYSGRSHGLKFTVETQD